MNIQDNQNQNNESQCCIDYCKTSFNSGEQEVTNTRKCNQKQLSSADVWNIQKNKREFGRRNY